MSGKNIGVKQFHKPVKIQQDKTNDIRDDGIEKIPQSQARKIDSSNPYHPKNDFSFLVTMFDIQKQFCQHEWFKKHP